MPLNSRGQRMKSYSTAKALRKRKPKKKPKFSTGGTVSGSVGGGT